MPKHLFSHLVIETKQLQFTVSLKRTRQIPQLKFISLSTFNLRMLGCLVFFDVDWSRIERALAFSRVFDSCYNRILSDFLRYLFAYIIGSSLKGLHLYCLSIFELHREIHTFTVAGCPTQSAIFLL